MIVLLVEDDVVNQRVATRFLEKAGCTVELAEHGAAAVAKVENASDRFEVIFMDCEMPVMDGFEATRRIRAIEACARTPIVAMTAHSSAGDRERCLQAGMSDYVAKPVRSEEISAALARVMGQWGASSSTADRTAPLFNPDAMIDTFDGETEAIGELIELLARDVPAYIQNARQAASARDLTTVGRMGHKVKGAVGIVSAERMQELAQRLELDARRADESPDRLLQIGQQIDALDQAAMELIEALRAWHRGLDASRRQTGDQRCAS